MLTRADDYDAIDHSNDYHDGHDNDGYGNLQEKHDDMGDDTSDDAGDDAGDGAGDDIDNSNHLEEYLAAYSTPVSRCVHFLTVANRPLQKTFENHGNRGKQRKQRNIRDSFQKRVRPHLGLERLPLGGKFTSYGKARAKPMTPSSSTVSSSSLSS